MKRRTFLALLGTGTTAAIAGCTTGQDNDYDFGDLNYTFERKTLTQDDSIFVTPGTEKTALKLTVNNYGNADSIYIYIHKDDFVGQQIQENKDVLNYNEDWYYFAHFNSETDEDNIGELKPPSDTEFFFRGQENGEYYGFEPTNRLLITATPPVEDREKTEEEHIIEEITVENI